MIKKTFLSKTKLNTPVEKFVDLFSPSVDIRNFFLLSPEKDLPLNQHLIIYTFS